MSASKDGTVVGIWYSLAVLGTRIQPVSWICHCRATYTRKIRASVDCSDWSWWRGEAPHGTRRLFSLSATRPILVNLCCRRLVPEPSFRVAMSSWAGPSPFASAQHRSDFLTSTKPMVVLCAYAGNSCFVQTHPSFRYADASSFCLLQWVTCQCHSGAKEVCWSNDRKKSVRVVVWYVFLELFALGLWSTWRLAGLPKMWLSSHTYVCSRGD